MAIDFKKMQEEMRREAKKGMAPVIADEGWGIRCCSEEECIAWRGAQRGEGQGAGFSLEDEGAFLSPRLIASVDGGRHFGATHLVVLKKCPLGMAERYMYRRGESLKKINSIGTGAAVLVDWKEMRDQNPEILADWVIQLKNA